MGGRAHNVLITLHNPDFLLDIVARRLLQFDTILMVRVVAIGAGTLGSYPDHRLQIETSLKAGKQQTLP